MQGFPVSDTLAQNEESGITCHALEMQAYSLKPRTNIAVNKYATEGIKGGLFSRLLREVISLGIAPHLQEMVGIILLWVIR